MVLPAAFVEVTATTLSEDASATELVTVLPAWLVVVTDRVVSALVSATFDELVSVKETTEPPDAIEATTVVPSAVV